MNVSEISNSFLYGKGVFTTVRIGGAEPFLWEKHWSRITENAARLEIDIGHISEKDVIEAVRAENAMEGRVRITISDLSVPDLWKPENVNGKAAFSVVSGPLRKCPETFRITFSPILVNSTSPLAGVKSCNYLEQISALEEVKARGFHEAVRVNEHGKVVSGCMSNLFWSKGGRLFTPMLETGCLNGTTREYILEHMECEQVLADADEVRNADSVFFSSAGLGVVRAAELDGRKFAASDDAVLDICPI